MKDKIYLNIYLQWYIYEKKNCTNYYLLYLFLFCTCYFQDGDRRVGDHCCTAMSIPWSVPGEFKGFVLLLTESVHYLLLGIGVDCIFRKATWVSRPVFSRWAAVKCGPVSWHFILPIRFSYRGLLCMSTSIFRPFSQAEQQSLMHLHYCKGQVYGWGRCRR